MPSNRTKTWNQFSQCPDCLAFWKTMLVHYFLPPLHIFSAAFKTRINIPCQKSELLFWSDPMHACRALQPYSFANHKSLESCAVPTRPLHSYSILRMLGKLHGSQTIWTEMCVLQLGAKDAAVLCVLLLELPLTKVRLLNIVRAATANNRIYSLPNLATSACMVYIFPSIH